MRVVELIDFPEGFGHATTARTRFLNDTLIICCDNGPVVCFDLTQQRVRDVTVTP